MFFKDEQQKTAVDYALDENLFESVSLMIKYICRYQNYWAFSHLFEHNLVRLLQNPVVDALTELFESEIFLTRFDYTDTDAVSNENSERMMAPYHGCVFDLRDSYAEVWPQFVKRPIESFPADLSYSAVSEFSDPSETPKKEEQIRYRCLLLGKIKNYEGMTLMNALAAAEDEYLPIFSTPSVQMLLEYKWNRFAQNVHIVGACIHSVYVVSLGYYIYTVFLLR